MGFIMICLFFILIWLPAQWANGATLWESLAPNEPVMATVWFLIIGSVFFLIYLKIHDDNYMEKEARKNGWVDENATRTEAIVEYGRKEWEREKTLYELNVEMCELYRRWQREAAELVRRGKEEHWSFERDHEEGMKISWMLVRKHEIYDYLSKQKDYQINMYL